MKASLLRFGRGSAQLLFGGQWGRFAEAHQLNMLGSWPHVYMDLRAPQSLTC